MLKFLCEALSAMALRDQAARVSDPLAWSYAQSRVSDPPDLFEAFAWVWRAMRVWILTTNNANDHELNLCGGVAA